MRKVIPIADIIKSNRVCNEHLPYFITLPNIGETLARYTFVDGNDVKESEEVSLDGITMTSDLVLTNVRIKTPLVNFTHISGLLHLNHCRFDEDKFSVRGGGGTIKVTDCDLTKIPDIQCSLGWPLHLTSNKISSLDGYTQKGVINLRGNPLSEDALKYWSGKGVYEVVTSNFYRDKTMKKVWKANSILRETVGKVSEIKDCISSLLSY